MIINYPEMIINKSNGFNKSESYLSQLCEKTFLKLWSYPNCFRDQGRKTLENGQKSGDGKELCDLLAVFDEHVFIFSDKDCKFPEIDDINLAWARWYKKAVDEAANQILGAERWLFSNPDKIFLDSKCTRKFPIKIPSKINAKIHRIVIAHGASKKCKEWFPDGSGSLLIDNQIIGKQHFDGSTFDIKPFHVGLVSPQKGFIHVLDDFSIDAVMQSVDTVTDFTNYLEEKERFLLSKKQIYAAGEEELLTLYLTSSDINGEKSFSKYYIDQNPNAIIVNNGSWRNYQSSSLYSRLVEANKTSYFWDNLITKFLYHITTGTSGYMYPSDILSQEEIFKILAKENRIRRRILSDILIDLINKANEDILFSRTILPSKSCEPAYIFLLLPINSSTNQDDFLNFRRSLLRNYAYMLKNQNPLLESIIGIAIDPKEQGLGEEVMFLDAKEWGDVDREEASIIEETMRASGLIGNRTARNWVAREYPNSNNTHISGNERNLPCPCGSGKKYKKCCGKSYKF